MYEPELSLVLLLYRDKVSHENPLNENFCGNHRTVMSWKVPRWSTNRSSDEETQQS